ncbi:MAG: Mpo1-like protein [Rhodospirillaceae bacterium]|nr:Mpo1-like protein [Rhodospirillaceae bacterium]
MREWFLDQLAMYAAYHRDKRNQATHHIGVPLIVYALLVALTQLPLPALGPVPLTAATLVLVVLLAFYLMNLPAIGAVALLIYGALYAVAAEVGRMSPEVVWTTFGVCFVGGWIIQFVGHVFEGRRPALFNNILQIFMAPPFLIAEMMFAMGLERELARQIEVRKVKYLPRMA